MENLPDFIPFQEVENELKEYNVVDESDYVVCIRKENPKNHSDHINDDFSNPVIFYNIGRIIEGRHTKKYKKPGAPTKEELEEGGEIWIYESDDILDACYPIIDNSLNEKLVVVVRYDDDPIDGRNYTKSYYRKFK